MEKAVMDFGLQGKAFVVTGASGDIGWAISKLLKKYGGIVYGIDINNPVDFSIFEEFVAGDVTNENEVQAFVKKTQGKSIEGVICCAGTTGEVVDAEYIDLKKFESTMSASVTHSMLFIKYYSAYFKKRGFGSFILFSSTAGLRGNALMPAYTAAKHAIIGLVRSFSRELGPWGIRVNAVLPGLIESSMSRGIEFEMNSRGGVARLGKQLDPSAAKNIPLRTIGSPEDIAYSVLFLSSPMAKYANGALLNIDGGLLSK